MLRVRIDRPTFLDHPLAAPFSLYIVSFLRWLLYRAPYSTSQHVQREPLVYVCVESFTQSDRAQQYIQSAERLFSYIFLFPLVPYICVHTHTPHSICMYGILYSVW